MKDPTRQSNDSETKRWLEQAATWRYFSLLFQFPTRENRSELRRLTRDVPPELRDLAEKSFAHTLKALEMEFHRVLGSGGIPALESSYDDNALAGRGPLLADVRAFYEAFSYQPEKPPAELPDHIAVELDFLAYLAMKIAFAHHENQVQAEQTTKDACERFLQQHVCEWVARFAAQIAVSGSPLYVDVAALLCDRLSVPVHS